TAPGDHPGACSRSPRGFRTANENGFVTRRSCASSTHIPCLALSGGTMNASHSHSSTLSLRPVLAILVFAGWLAGSFAVAEEPNATWEAGQLTSRTRVTDLVMDPSGRSVFVRYTSKDGTFPTELIDVFTGKEIGAVKPGEVSQRSVGFFSPDGGTLVL